MNVVFRGLIGNYTAMIGNLVQIQPLVTQHPTKGFSKQRSYLEFHVFFHYFCNIFYKLFSENVCNAFLNYFPLKKNFGLFIFHNNRPIFTFSQIRYDLWLLT